MEIKNINVLKDFMGTKFKGDYYDLEAVKEEVRMLAMGGGTCYTLRSYETVTGHTEILEFECDPEKYEIRF